MSAANSSNFYILQYCNDERTTPFIRLRAMARERGLNYDCCYAAVCRLKKWCAQMSPNGVLPDDSFVIQDITQFPDGGSLLTQLLQSAGILEPVANGFYLSHWHEEQTEQVTAPAKTKRKKSDAGYLGGIESGAVRRGETVEKGGELKSGHVLSAVPPQKLLEFSASEEPAPYAKQVLREVEAEQKRTEQSRKENKREETTAVVVGNSSFGLGSVLSDQLVWMKIHRAVTDAVRWKTYVGKLIESWKAQCKYGGSRVPSEEAIYDFLALCLDAPTKKRKTEEQYVFGLIKDPRLDPPQETIKKASVIWQRAGELVK